METKRCTKCGEEKELGEFSKCNRYKDGFINQCKACKRTYSRTYRKTEKGKAKKKIYRVSIKYKAQRKVYYERHKEYFRAYAKEYRSTEKGEEYAKAYRMEKGTEVIERWRANNPDKILKNQIKANFKRRNGFPLPEDIIEVKFLINKTKQLCKTSTN